MFPQCRYVLCALSLLFRQDNLLWISRESYIFHSVCVMVVIVLVMHVSSKFIVHSVTELYCARISVLSLFFTEWIYSLLLWSPVCVIHMWSITAGTGYFIYIGIFIQDVFECFDIAAEFPMHVEHWHVSSVAYYLLYVLFTEVNFQIFFFGMSCNVGCPLYLSLGMYSFIWQWSISIGVCLYICVSILLEYLCQLQGYTNNNQQQIDTEECIA